MTREPITAIMRSVKREKRGPVLPHHTVAADPGTSWTKDAEPAIDAPPDVIVHPAPEGQWSRDALRTGVYGVVTPNVVMLPEGGYRMYYTQILPRPGFPGGANDYANAATRILSALSWDATAWTPEPGVRLSPQQFGGKVVRVVSPEVVPLADGSGRLRMYYESCPGPEMQSSTIRSAVSEDGGLQWTVEPGERLAEEGESLISPRVVYLDDGRCRLYCGLRGGGIVSAVSEDGGSTFLREPGVRIEPGNVYDALIPFAPEVLRIDGAGYRMYYGGYSAPNRAYVLGAVSSDGLTWRKDTEPIVSPGGRWDRVKCSEMCVIELPAAGERPSRYRLFYEACDGTAVDERGVWRIAGATADLGA